MFPNWLGLQQLEESLAHPTHGVSFDSMGRRIQSSMYRMAAELSRVARVKEAVARSVPLGMADLRHTLAGIDLGSVLHVLTSLLRDLLAAYACGALVGGAVGGAIGAFAGAGVGAVPGAIGGMGLGMSLTTWLLGWLGLGLLAKEIAETLPAAFKEYRDGALEAWGPPNEPAYASHREPFAPTGSVGLAAMRMARGHRLLLLTLLSGIMMYFSRGAASRLELLSKIRSSQRLGPAVADWVEANERRLMEHPALRRRTSGGQGGGAAAEGGAANAESFEQAARGQGRRVLGNAATATADSPRGLSKAGGIYSSTSNEAGGTIWTSEGPITQDDFSHILNGELMQGRDVNIITGVHGNVDGTIASVDPQMHLFDVDTFGEIPGVTIHNFPDLTADQLKVLLNGKDTVIGGFCSSGACLAPYR